MTRHHQKVSMREDDCLATKFDRPYFLTVSKTWALILVLIFLAAIIVTSLITYFLTTSCVQKEHSIESPPPIIKLNSGLDTTAVTTTTAKQTSAQPCHSQKVSTTTPSSRHVQPNLRLPKSLYPLSYEIKIIPFIFEGNFTFNGEVTIAINVTEPCKNVTLHAMDLSIGDVTVRTIASLYMTIRNVTKDSERQFLVIHLDDDLVPGEPYYVTVTYTGVLNDLLQGFYRSSYRVDNETRWIAATQFQATDARRAFPCFDEPEFKATFRISLARPKNMSAISNMPKTKQRMSQSIPDLPDYEWDHFADSLPMSTYLVAFVVSDFESITHGNFSIWARKSALSQAKYSLEIGPKILKFYEEFFDIPYPLPKVDMIAIPDFSAGAMENWGLITYRESVLLYEERVSSKRSLQRIAHVIAHELAHQWFGNLVTPEWWSDLWLNEGFATYMETLGADAVHPEWKEDDQFLVNELHGALSLDALKSSHQISIEVNNPDEINDIFDQISYSKGASILRMMQHFLTMPVFRRGLTAYLKSRMYGNAKQDDLWNTFTEISRDLNLLDDNVTVKDVMDTWTLQTGVPLVEIMRNYTRNQATIKQTRLLVNGKDGKDETLWYIPVTFLDHEGNFNAIWLNKEREVTVNVTADNWLLFNVNQTGYYRVNYDAVNWERLTKQLLTDHNVIDAKNRAQLLDDSQELALSGYLDYNTALNVTRYLKNEREFVPWKAAIENLDFIYEMLIRTEHFDLFKAYIVNLMSDFYYYLGFDEKAQDTQLDLYSRSVIFYWACEFGVSDCIINAVQQFQTWRNSPNPDRHNTIPENLRSVIYCTAIRLGGQEEWDFAWQRFLNANVENEKETLIFALGCSRETWILTRYLQRAISDNAGIRKHESPRVFSAVTGNPIGQSLAYAFLKTNWNRIRTHLGTSSMALSTILRGCTASFNTETDLDDLKAFLQKHEHQLGIASRTAKQSLERGLANVKWMEQNYKTIVEWLSRT